MGVLQHSDEAMYICSTSVWSPHTMHSDERVSQARRNCTLTTEEVHLSNRGSPHLMEGECDIWATYTVNTMEQ